jgi:sugar/nucleoside kinase (ribokinase family)
MVTEDGFFSLPAYPLETVIDPTGAGDTFAGGFVGYVAQHIDQPLTDDVLRRAMAYGTALASYNVEEFGTERVARLSSDEVQERVAAIHGHALFDLKPAALVAG